jgi:hypothetical protein
MFGFDFHTYLTDMMVSNGNVQFLWHALPKDKVEMCYQTAQKMKRSSLGPVYRDVSPHLRITQSLHHIFK